MFLQACGGLPRSAGGPGGGIVNGDRDGAPSAPIDLDAIVEPVPRAEPLAKYGNPPYYEVFGKGYSTLISSAGYVERGIASWYGTKFHNRRTSSGEPYDLYAISAAHKSLPLPTYVRVTNLRNGRTLIVRVNDRGPFHENRIIDLSYAAAAKLGILATGTGLVEVRAIDPRDGGSDVMLADAGAAAAPSGYAPATVAATPVAATQTIADEPVPDIDAAPPIATVGSAAPASNMYLQVGAFLSAENAERLRARLARTIKAGIRVVQAEVNKNIIYRVRLGPLRDVGETDRLTETITRLGIGTPRVVID